MALRDPDWRNLAEHVLRRRNALGLTQTEVQAAGGPSVGLIRQIEGAADGNYRGTVLGRLEQALRWEPGSVEAVLVGGNPTPMQGTTAFTPGASAMTTGYLLPDGRVVKATEASARARARPEVAFSEETEKELRRIAGNPSRSPGLRAMAKSLLDQLAAVREADEAEAKTADGQQAS